jgi:hypothetical protein
VYWADLAAALFNTGIEAAAIKTAKVRYFIRYGLYRLYRIDICDGESMAYNFAADKRKHFVIHFGYGGFCSYTLSCAHPPLRILQSLNLLSPL